ncbi:MAG: DVU0298 family protein [Elusimicrobiota bacterium]
MTREDLTKLVEKGDPRAILEALSDPSLRGKFLRRIVALLNSIAPSTKWRAVSAMGVAAGEGGVGADKVERQVQRFLWAMNEESGAVPYGVPEALGEILALRPELKGRILPLLVSYVADKELFQTGPILAGAIWALGRAGVHDAEEMRRALPGLKAALLNGGPDVRGAALWTSARLGLAKDLEDQIRPLSADPDAACLMIDGKIEEVAIADLAKRALG